MPIPPIPIPPIPPIIYIIYIPVSTLNSSANPSVSKCAEKIISVSFNENVAFEEACSLKRSVISSHTGGKSEEVCAIVAGIVAAIIQSGTYKTGKNSFKSKFTLDLSFKKSSYVLPQTSGIVFLI